MDPSQHHLSHFDGLVAHEIIPQIKTPELVPIVERFSQNIQRAHGLISSMGILLGIAQRTERCLRHACLDLTGHFDPPSELRTKKFEEDVKARAIHMIRQEQAYDMEHGTDLFFQQISFSWGFMMHLFGSIDETQSHLRAIRESMLLLLWSSFETCFEELFQRSRGVCARFALLSGSELRISELAAQLTQNPETVNKFSSKGKERFTSLSKIREAYSRAVDIDSTDLDAALASDKLDALSLIRNLIVHDAGNVDRDFENRAKYNTTLLKYWQPGGLTVDITGGMTGDIASGALSVAVDAIQAVDIWIQNH